MKLPFLLWILTFGAKGHTAYFAPQYYCKFCCVTWHRKLTDSPGFLVWFSIVFCICGGPQVSTARKSVVINIFEAS